eukprot:scaffold1053_cov107-Isochrysis_galbana.AAC.21
MRVCTIREGPRSDNRRLTLARVRHEELAQTCASRARDTSMQDPLHERGGEDAVVRRELKSGEDHVLDIPPLARVVLVGAHHLEGSLWEEDEILGVLVALDGRLRLLGRLLKLRLQICPCVVRGVVLRVGRVSPARGVALGVVVDRPVEHVLQLARHVSLVRVCVQAEDERAVGHRVRHLVHRRQHRLGGEAVGVAVEGGKQVTPAWTRASGEGDGGAAGATWPHGVCTHPPRLSSTESTFRSPDATGTARVNELITVAV